MCGVNTRVCGLRGCVIEVPSFSARHDSPVHRVSLPLGLGTGCFGGQYRHVNLLQQWNTRSVYLGKEASILFRRVVLRRCVLGGFFVELLQSIFAKCVLVLYGL